MTKFVVFFSFILTISSTFAQTPVLQENFQSGIPQNWILLNNDGNTPAPQVSEYTEAWILKQDPDSSQNLTASSTSFFSPEGQANRWLITPVFTLGSYGNSFSWKAKSHDASFPDNYIVMVLKDGNDPESFYDTLANIEAEEDSWVERSVNLSSRGYDNDAIAIAFILKTTDGFKLYLDDIVATKEDETGLNEHSLIVKVKYLANGNILLPNDFVPTQVIDVQGKVIPYKRIGNQISIEQKGLFFLQGKINHNSLNLKISL